MKPRPNVGVIEERRPLARREPPDHAITRAHLALFIRQVLAGDHRREIGPGLNWGTIMVNHYEDELMERVRRDVVRHCIHAPMTGATYVLTAAQQAEIMRWVEELERDAR